MLVGGHVGRWSGGGILAFVMFLAHVWLTPFYLWESGLPQPSHIVGALLIFGLSVFRRRFVWDRRVMVPIVLFAAYSSSVNAFVYVNHKDTHLILSGLYYIYNGLLFCAVLQVLRSYKPLRVWRYLSLSFLPLLALQVGAFLLGWGRFFGEGRFMGTFNDPNQMAHWSLWAAIIVLVSDYVFRGKLGWASWLALAFGLMLLLASSSRSGLLGFLIFVLAVALSISGKGVRLRRSLLQKGVIVFGTVVILGGTFLTLLWLASSNEKVQALREKVASQAEFFVVRINQGLSKSKNNLEERGYDRLWKFPEYLILGAGEGANERWAEKTTFLGEIHSTLAGVIFYYGAPGALLIFAFLANVWASLPRFWLKLLMLAPLLYSLGTYNLRNSMFWLGMAVLWEAARVLRNRG